MFPSEVVDVCAIVGDTIIIYDFSGYTRSIYNMIHKEIMDVVGFDFT